ncbi:TPA: hypothetical protein RQK28_000691 [Vibrio vulnificus]|nr:hypothetical protein [Vibrio vulnificus]
MNTEKTEKPKLLENPRFRLLMFTLLMTANFVVNLDYIQPRDSSKANLSFPL